MALLAMALQSACCRAAGQQVSLLCLGSSSLSGMLRHVLPSCSSQDSCAATAQQSPSSSCRCMSTSSGANTSSSSSSRTAEATRQSIQQIRARIFDQHIGDGRRSGRKALLRQLKGRHIANWYFTLTGPKMPMMQDEFEEERVLKVQLARATGGGPPKKGQGKRAGKKK